MAISGARPATGIGIFGGRPRVRPRQVARPRRRSGADRRRRQMTSVSGILVALAVAAGLAFFYLSPSTHVAAIGYQITGLEAQLAELRAEQQQLILQIGEARSPAVITRRAKYDLNLVELPAQSVTFAQRSIKQP